MLIATAEPQRIEQTREVARSLNRLGLRPGALIVNRVMEPLPDLDELRRARLPSALRHRLQRNFADFNALKTREAACLEKLTSLGDGIPTLTAADLGAEPGKLKDLVRIARSFRMAN